MPYIADRVVHDADSHTMELAHWLDDFAERRVRDAFNARFGTQYAATLAEIVARHDDPAYRAANADEIMLRKNHAATGSFRRKDRCEALDLIGVASQLVFPTSPNVWLEELEHGDDLDLLYGAAAATNRAQVAFCSVDPRLLPVGYVPLADLDRAPAVASEAIELGIKALLVPWLCPKQHATSHVALDAVWSQAVDAGLPILSMRGVPPRAPRLRALSTSAPPTAYSRPPTRTTACRRFPISTAARRTSARSPTWRSRTVPCRRYRC